MSGMNRAEKDSIGDADDPVTYEVLRNRFEAITEEMRIALQQVSGSTTVTEASDFFTGLFLPDGRFTTMGFQVTSGGPTVGLQIQYLMDEKITSIEPGDMFIGNDPYIGALHQNDVQMAAPIFHEGELVAWAGVMAHETDVGGMDFASWSPEAEEIYQEGFRIPCVKLVTQEGVREDILEMILNASRMPHELGIDIRAFIATLKVARDRVEELIDRYGVNTISGVMQKMLHESATETRRLLSELPDGTVHVSDFLEHDGHENRLYKVDLVMEKKGDSLRMDFSGSSEQAPGFINTTRSGLLAGVTQAVLPTLGFEIKWNHGMIDPVEIVAPDGLICTAEHPAPVGAATIETCWVVGNVVAQALNKLLACSDDYRHRARAGSNGAMATFNMGGRNQFGEHFGFHMLDPIAGGLGACGDTDGIDAGGPLWIPKPRIADVERNEQRAPLRYLYRRLATDSSDHGRTRGGMAVEAAFHPYGTESAEGLVMTHGQQVPNSVGLFGGYPGATVQQRFGEGVLAEDGSFPSEPIPEDIVDLEGEWSELSPKPGRFPMDLSDVFAVSWQGGGGFGDPIERDPSAVAADVRENRVTERAAREIYGVVLTERSEVDEPATIARRREIRKERVGGRICTRPGDVDVELSLGSSVALVDTEEGWITCSPAGYTLTKGTTEWRNGAVARQITPNELPETIQLHEDLMMKAFYCPRSGSLLSVDVHEVDREPDDDIKLDLDNLASSRM